MTQQTRGPRVHERWAHLRFSVIGQLLAAPPAKGELKAAIEGLAGRTWQHPTTGEPVRFGFSTIEHWYYRALKERTDPVGVLRRKVRANAGRQHAISDAVRQVVLAQYAAHKSWSVQLHHDNLVALAETRPELKPMPSYPTLRRFMRVNGLDKRRRVTSRQTDGADRAEDKLADREIRGYEAEYVGSLWHWDCHHGSKKVLTGRGEWVTPILFGVLDDRSRLACHLQWYLVETAEIIAHGLSQAFQKRGLPRSALSDNGAAMTAAEIAGWDLGLVHLVDERTGMVLTRLYPQDKTQNASGLRRTLSSIANGSATPMPTDVEPATGLPPLLARMLDQQAATGLPPAYLPKDEEGETP